MKLLFKQRLFSWFDSYDIYDEAGERFYTVKGRMDWGHRLEIYDRNGDYLGRIKEEVLSFRPRFALYVGENCIGMIKKEWTLFSQNYSLDYNGWTVQGNFMGWDYQVYDDRGNQAAAVTKQLMRMTDTYVIDVRDPAHALTALMIVLAIDAANCNK